MSKSRRLIITELRCQGRTELLSENSTVEQHVADFHQLMKNNFGIDRIQLAGFSFGGRIGMAIAASYPDLVEK